MARTKTVKEDIVNEDDVIIEDRLNEKLAKDIKRIKMNNMLSGSYGVFSKDRVYTIPESIDLVTATLFVNEKLADVIE